MHELSIMQGVLDMVRDSAVQNGISRINRLKLVIGSLTMIMPDSLRFAFEVLSQDDLVQGAVLEIEEVMAVISCQDCGVTSPLEDIYYYVCPLCGGQQVDILKGREMYLDYYEGDRI